MLGCPPINACLHNGKCVDKPFGFACICQEEYHGHRCQFKRKLTTLPPNYLTNQILQIDDNGKSEYHSSVCDEKRFKCKNNGVCIITQNGFQCQCLPNYTGVNCEIEFEFRVSKMKLNNITTHFTPSKMTLITKHHSKSPKKKLKTKHNHSQSAKPTTTSTSLLITT